MTDAVTDRTWFSASVPADFAERGVMVPFTSPVLAGARLRRGADGGVRVLLPGHAVPCDWPSLSAAARVTLHDRLLYRRLSADRTAALTPRSVGAAATDVALTGAAGRTARRAAAMTAQRREEDRRIALFLLVLRLSEALRIHGVDWRGLGPSDPAFDDWLAASARQAAPALATDAASLTAWLEQVSAVVAPVGLPGGEYTPQLALTMQNLEAFRDDAGGFAVTAADGESRGEALCIARLSALADRTLAQARRATAGCHADFSDLRRLHREWPQIGPAVIAGCERPDWLLDGWPMVCRLWTEAAAGGRRAQSAAAAEMARLTPPFAGDADGPYAGLLAAPPVERAPGDDPLMIDKILRNELLKAAAA